MNQNQNCNENKYEENEFLASFSQGINVEVEGYEFCRCSSTCIRNEITNLKSQVERMEENSMPYCKKWITIL